MLALARNFYVLVRSASHLSHTANDCSSLLFDATITILPIVSPEGENMCIFLNGNSMMMAVCLVGLSSEKKGDNA